MDTAVVRSLAASVVRQLHVFAYNLGQINGARLNSLPLARHKSPSDQHGSKRGGRYEQWPGLLRRGQPGIRRA
jgi:hypothetical protein